MAANKMNNKLDYFKMLDYTPPVLPKELEAFPDRVAEVYVGKTIFITGGSGFLGRVLIEKILRKSPDVKHIYMLLRPKKGKDPRQRVEELFNSPLFDLLKIMRGEEITKKVSCVAGDVMEPNLGLSSEDRKMLAEEVEIVFHGAATIRFDEPLRKAVLLNTRGTKYTLELAKEMKKLLVFVHISTSYCHLQEKVLYEKSYPPAANPHKIIKSVELMDEALVESVAKKILENFPNSYAYTKNLSEGLVVEFTEAGLPAMILRPSIVIPVWKEPLPGWTDNINGPTGLLIGAGKGVIRTMYCNNKGYADYLPVDICVNGILLAAWNYMYNKDFERNICHLTSSQEWQISWQEIIDVGKDIVTSDVPLNGGIWYPGGSMKTSRFLHNICTILFHWIPAYFLDAIIFLSGNKPVLCRVHDRVQKGFEVFEYYANNQWEFRNEHVHYLRKILNKRERFEYKIDGEDMDIRGYFMNCVMAARIFILKEMPESLPSAKRHMRMLYWLDWLTTLMFYGFIMWFFFNNSEFFLAVLSKISSLFFSSASTGDLTHAREAASVKDL
nr:PREDICTED: putative fatty acyl-CoA reductase CG5065 [Bemisia tabaci]